VVATGLGLLGQTSGNTEKSVQVLFVALNSFCLWTETCLFKCLTPFSNQRFCSSVAHLPQIAC